MEEYIEELKHLNRLGNVLGLKKHIAIENVLKYIDELEKKIMYALGPANHEFALEIQRNFKRIIRENINEDTYTIKQELKKYWNNQNTYWKKG